MYTSELRGVGLSEGHTQHTAHTHQHPHPTHGGGSMHGNQVLNYKREKKCYRNKKVIVNIFDKIYHTAFNHQMTYITVMCFIIYVI